MLTTSNHPHLWTRAQASLIRTTLSVVAVAATAAEQATQLREFGLKQKSSGPSTLK
jgi:hypothetical protein